ncbi:toprim domain-containing protein [Defluviimonas sp. WL0075]|uniref:Toprim domain-containing protein n=1 Tax=Albidovulum sediminicola TaxID=2984331 RepID=A0ABT2Z0P7_9RHOB|nr:toprim domain-containing protein [Defluviimonas sp. WL0075]MCV2864592.1 toprim domain-containing protein [Defluviimonas sp. WL0075]
MQNVATGVERFAKGRLLEFAKNAERAKAIWQEALPIQGSVADLYLRHRGITASLPETLRYHPKCWHGPTARHLPAMIARVDGGDHFAIHRTYLRQDGLGNADLPNGTKKLMLGACGGGHVELSCAEAPVVVAEGIETALSLASGLLTGPAAIWAALSTSGLVGLRLPRRPGRLIVASDGDNAGRGAGNKLAFRAAALGWDVSLLPAPEGSDWNDFLTKAEA